MSYCFTKSVSGDILSVEKTVITHLKEKGFGVLTEIDVAATFKKKLDKDLYPYKILGACNPKLAFEAIASEDKIGVMLPCNVILQEKKSGEVEVSAVDPLASMQAIQNEKLGGIAQSVHTMLKDFIDTL